MKGLRECGKHFTLNAVSSFSVVKLWLTRMFTHGEYLMLVEETLIVMCTEVVKQYGFIFVEIVL